MTYSVIVTSADYMQGTRMSFKSKEDAIHFAEKQGMFVSAFARYPKLSKPLAYRLGLLHVSISASFSYVSRLISVPQ